MSRCQHTTPPHQHHPKSLGLEPGRSPWVMGSMHTCRHSAILGCDTGVCDLQRCWMIQKAPPACWAPLRERMVLPQSTSPRLCHNVVTTGLNGGARWVLWDAHAHSHSWFHRVSWQWLEPNVHLGLGEGHNTKHSRESRHHTCRCASA